MGNTKDLIVSFLVLLLATFGAALAQGEIDVTIVTDIKPGPGAMHGVEKVKAALDAKGRTYEVINASAKVKGKCWIIAGIAQGGGAAASLLRSRRLEPPAAPESLLIHRAVWRRWPVYLAAGADDRGVMYALLDIADRIGWSDDPENPLSEVEDVRESPYVSERALSMYTMHPAAFEQRFFSVDHWERYLDMLAENRFNTFVLIFGYSPATHFAPPYPFFFDVEGFPEVHAEGVTKDEQRRNLDMLNKVIQMTHERGLDFTLGIWDHIPRGGTTTPYYPYLPKGLSREKLAPYTMAAVPKLLELVPDIDAIQFRMHWESGLTREETPGFWINVLKAIRNAGSDVRIDARAKGLPDEVIDEAVKLGLNFRITTKYWAEEMGPPFHPTHINVANQHDRRHGYADLLTYPKRYPMHWKLWNGGTTKVLLWGDPEYARRFAASTLLYDGEGYEVNEPLATKMAFAPGERPFDVINPKYRYYDWEFERYWHFFQVFGRLGYNPNTSPRVWRTEFESRFGAAAPYVEQGLHRASQVLPRIIGYAMAQFPTLGDFLLKQSGGPIQNYVKVLPSDIQQFLSFEEDAELILSGGTSPKRSPRQTAAWFGQCADDILEQVRLADNHAGKGPSNEFRSTMTDLRILGNLARYHSIRPYAAVNLALYNKTGGLEALNVAIHYEEQAIEAWKALVEAAGDFYPHNMKMDRGDSGHWKGELAKLEKGLEELRQTKPSAKKKGEGASHVVKIGEAASGDNTPPACAHTPVTRHPIGQPLTIKAQVTDPSGVEWVRLRYRGVTQFQDYETMDMRSSGEEGEYRATVPADAIDPAWDFMYFIEVMDTQGNGRMYPDLEIEQPYVIVKLDRG